MKKKKRNIDFVESKSRVGKSQFRKYGSKEDKYLSNVSKFKKIIRIPVQSIAVKKNNLNVTSRGLTLAELIGKSRHISENVRNHALLGILEFTRRYEEESKLNTFAILQVASSNLTSESENIRKNSKNLLISTVSSHLRGASGFENRCTECLFLHLNQGLFSASEVVREDVYQVINMILEKTPWVLSGYANKLLLNMFKNSPTHFAPKHVECVYMLFKNYKSEEGDSISQPIADYCLGHIEQYYSVYDPEKSITDEVKFLIVSSTVLKLFKLLLMNVDGIRPNDEKVVNALLNFEPFEFERLTVRGKDVYDLLSADLTLTMAELSVKLLKIFTKFHIPLLGPLIHLANYREALSSGHSDRICLIIMNIITLDTSRLLSQSVSKIEERWIRQLSISIEHDQITFSPLKEWLRSYIGRIKTHKDSFGVLTDEEDTSEENDNEEETLCLNVEECYKSLANLLANTVSRSPSILPIVAIMKRQSPLVFAELFPKGSGHKYWEYLGNLPMDIKANLHLEIDCDTILDYFAKTDQGTKIRTVALSLILYISKEQVNLEELYPIEDLLSPLEFRKLSQEQELIISRILANIQTSGTIVEHLTKIITARLLDPNLCCVKVVRELVNVLLYHVFNANVSGIPYPYVDGKLMLRVGPDRFEKYLESLYTSLSIFLSAPMEIEIKCDEVVEIVEMIVSISIERTLYTMVRSSYCDVKDLKHAMCILFDNCFVKLLKELICQNKINIAVSVLNVITMYSHKDEDSSMQPYEEVSIFEWMLPLTQSDKLSLYSSNVMDRIKIDGESPREEHPVVYLCKKNTLRYKNDNM